MLSQILFGVVLSGDQTSQERTTPNKVIVPLFSFAKIYDKRLRISLVTSPLPRRDYRVCKISRAME